MIVLVDPEDPTNYTLAGEQNAPRALVVLAGAVVLVNGFFLVAGFGGALRARRQRRRLRRAPWRNVEVRTRVRQSLVWQRVVFALRIPDSRTVLLGLVRSLQWAPDSSATTQRLEVVGGEHGYWVVRASQSKTLLSAREPFTAWGRWRWARRIADRQTEVTPWPAAPPTQRPAGRDRRSWYSRAWA